MGVCEFDWKLTIRFGFMLRSVIFELFLMQNQIGYEFAEVMESRTDTQQPNSQQQAYANGSNSQANSPPKPKVLQENKQKNQKQATMQQGQQQGTMSKGPGGSGQTLTIPGQQRGPPNQQAQKPPSPESLQQEVRNVLWGGSEEEQRQQPPQQRQSQQRQQQPQQYQQGAQQQPRQNNLAVPGPVKQPQQQQQQQQQSQPQQRPMQSAYTPPEHRQPGGAPPPRGPVKQPKAPPRPPPQQQRPQQPNRQVEDLRRQLEEITVQYDYLVEERKDKEQAEKSLSVLAYQYERLEMERDHLQEKLQEMDAHIQRIEEQRNQYAQAHNALIEEHNALIADNQKMRQYVENEEKQLFAYQSYIENVINENKQLLADNQQYRQDRENLMQQLNKKILEEKTANSSTFEVDRLNRLIRIKDNEIQQLKLSMDQPAPTTASSQQSDLRVTTLERRIQMLTAQLQKNNSIFLSKNKQILQLKSRNFELQQLSKSNTELRSAQLQVEKLMQMLSTKTAEVANLKANSQLLQRKVAHLEMASREAESLKTSSGELEGARDSLHKKDLELTRARQTVASKDSLIADLQAEKEQMRKRIGQLEGQGDADKQEYRARVGHLEQRIADQDKKQRQAENQLREKLAHAESQKFSIKSADQDRVDRIKLLESQLAESARGLEHERSEYFALRKNYEDKLYSLEGIKGELESRLSHALYDLELKDNQVARIDNQFKTVSADFNQLRSQNLQNLNTLNQLRLMLQRANTQLQNRKVQFQDAMRRASKDNQAYQQTIRLQQSKLQQLQSQAASLRKSPTRDSTTFRQQQAVQRQLHQLQLQVQHFQQLQLDQNKLSDLHKEILVQQNQIDGLNRQLEEKRAQELARTREAEQLRLRQESTVIELQRQLKQEQFNNQELRTKLEQDRRQLEQSRIEVKRIEDNRQMRQQQATQTPIKEVYASPDAVQRKPVVGVNKRADIFVELRKENQTLKATISSYASRVGNHHNLAESLVELQRRLGGFCQRIDHLLRENGGDPRGSEQGVKAMIGELANKVRIFKQENEELKRTLAGRDSKPPLPQGNPLQQMCQQLLEQNDTLRNLCDQFQGRIKEYQNQFLKMVSHSPASDAIRLPISNPFDIRNTIRGLQQKVDYFKLKNSQQQQRVTQLLKLNKQLKSQLQSIKHTSNQKDSEFYKQQLQFSQRNLTTLQDKLKQSLQQLNYTRNTELFKANQLNTELTNKLTQLQAGIFDLNLKISTAQTEKAYTEEERRQLLARLDALNAELKRLKNVEREQANGIEMLGRQLQDSQNQRLAGNARVEELGRENGKIMLANQELQITLNMRTEEKKQLEIQLARTNETVDNLSQQLNTIRTELIQNQTIMNEADNLVYYIQRAKATVTDLQTQLPELRTISNPMLSFSLSQGITKAAGIFKEIEFCKTSIKDSRKAQQKRVALSVGATAVY